jgi:serine/threonine protein kinase
MHLEQELDMFWTLVPMRSRWSLYVVIGLGVTVAASTAIQNLQATSTQQASRPFLLTGAVLAGAVAAWQLLAGLLLGAPNAVPAGQDPLTSKDPRHVGSYRLVARLGTGAMGRAYLATTRTGHYVAVKIIRPEHADNPEFRKRFAREIAAVGKVHGRHVATLIDADPQAETPWLITPYVAGPSLQEAVDTHGPLTSDAVWRLAAGMAEGLQVIHDAGMVHRDLKPGNVILAADGPYVIDFGIARAADASQLTATANRPGTPAFMAPEQALGQPAGPAADVFAFGVTLAYAATGRAPFGDGSSDGVLYRVIHEPPNLLGVDGDLRSLIEPCLDKNPEHRPLPAELLARCQPHLPNEREWPDTVATEIGQRAASVAAAARRTRAATRRSWVSTATSILALLTAVASAVLQFTHVPRSPAAGLTVLSRPPAVPATGPLVGISAAPSATVVPPNITPTGIAQSNVAPTSPSGGAPSREPAPTVSATVVGSTPNGTCSTTTVTFTGTINVSSGPTVVSYEWDFSGPDGGGSTSGTVNFPGTGPQQHTVTLSNPVLSNPSSGTYQAVLRVTGPTPTQSNQATIQQVCSTSAPSVSVTVVGSTPNGTCSTTTIVFTGTITVSSGPTVVSYEWDFSGPDGGGAMLGTESFSGTGQQQHTVTLSNPVSTNPSSGTYAASIRITDPSAAQSNQATIQQVCPG